MNTKQTKGDQFPYILGLDIGSNSIGWAVVKCKLAETVNKKSGEIKSIPLPTDLHSLNSRIFQEMVEAKTKEPKNKARREARGARKLIRRFKSRRAKLIDTLIAESLLPENYKQNPESCLNEIDRKFAERILKQSWNKNWSMEQQRWVSAFAIRAYAIDNPLEAHELGRLLLHLQTRRGYFSNRGIKYKELDKYIANESNNKQGRQDEHIDDIDKEDKETGKVLDGIAQLKKQLNNRTLGQYIWDSTKNKDDYSFPKRIAGHSITRDRKSKDKSDGTIAIKQENIVFYALRSMYEEEFECIWQIQAKTLKPKQAKSLKTIVDQCLFYQRPLKSQKSKVGNCSFKIDKRRTAIASLEFQEFRILQYINSIKVGDEKLNNDQRNTLYKASNDPNKLNAQNRISIAEIAKLLGIGTKDLNFSRGNDDAGKTGINGNSTVQSISKTLSEEVWCSLNYDNQEPQIALEQQNINKGFIYSKKQQDLVELLLTTANKLHLYKALTNPEGKWCFSRGFDGMADQLCRCELEGSYGKHCLSVINELIPRLREGDLYSEAAEKYLESTQEKQPNVLNKKEALDEIDVPNITNPIVQKSLWEMRRVVNAVIRRHGIPTVIRVELARDMKASKKRKRETEQRQQLNRKHNEAAEAELRKDKNFADTHLKRDDINKYKMWHNEQDKQCLYCGNIIAYGDLFQGNAEIEHIWPRSGFSQNYMNTIVACTTCNREKGQATPHQTWGATDRWPQIEKRVTDLSRATKLPRPKKMRILKEDWQAQDQKVFVQRQLRDTSYIATATVNMLKQIDCAIQTTKGGAVAQLRHYWGVNKVLNKEGIDIKNRADHRHHAIDAFMIAMTDHGTLMQLTKRYQNEDIRKIKKDSSQLELPKSWKDERCLDSLLTQKLLPATVSHMASRNISGALHEETAYGKSYYTRIKSLDTRGSTLTEISKYLATHPQAHGIVTWIKQESMHKILIKWLEQQEKLKPAERELPKDTDGNLIKEIVLAHRCYTVHKSLDKTLIEKYARIKHEPGEKSWIVDKQLHNSLVAWHKKYKIEELADNPPRVLNKEGKEGEVIKRVRIAQKFSAIGIEQLQEHKIFPKGNIHHVVIFSNRKEYEERKYQARFVYALEAKQRASQKELIIQKTPPPDWEGEWHYEMDLATNDLVYWTGALSKTLSTNKDVAVLSDNHIKYPIFRIQIISAAVNKITLRHCSVATTDSAWGRIITTPNTLKCKKIHLGNLGWTPDQKPLTIANKHKKNSRNK